MDFSMSSFILLIFILVLLWLQYKHIVIKEINHCFAERECEEKVWAKTNTEDDVCACVHMLKHVFVPFDAHWCRVETIVSPCSRCDRIIHRAARKLLELISSTKHILLSIFWWRITNTHKDFSVRVPFDVSVQVLKLLLYDVKGKKKIKYLTRPTRDHFCVFVFCATLGWNDTCLHTLTSVYHRQRHSLDFIFLHTVALLARGTTSSPYQQASYRTLRVSACCDSLWKDFPKTI